MQSNNDPCRRGVLPGLALIVAFAAGPGTAFSAAPAAGDGEPSTTDFPAFWNWRATSCNRRARRSGPAPRKPFAWSIARCPQSARTIPCPW